MADNEVQVKFGAETSGLTAGVEEAKGTLSDFADQAREVGEAVGIAFSIEKVIEFTKSALEAANSLEIFSERTGLSASTLSALNIPLLQSGSSAAELASSMRFLSRNIEQASEGNATAIQKFDDLGLSVSRLKELTPDQQLFSLAQALGQVSDQSRFTNDLIGLLGRSAQGLGPVIKETGGDLQDMTKHIKEMGGSLSDEEIKKVHEYDDAWISMWEHFKIHAVEALLVMQQVAAATEPGGNNIVPSTGATPGFLTDEQVASQFKKTQSPNPAAGGNDDIQTQADLAASEKEDDQEIKNYEAKVKAEQQLDKGHFDQILALQDQLLNTLASYYGKDSEQYQHALQEKYRIQQEMVAKQEADERKFFTSVQQGFDQMVNGVLQGTQTWQQAMARLFDNLALKFIDDFVVNAVISWVKAQTQMVQATIAGNAAITASNTATAATTAATTAASTQSSIGKHAASAAAAVYDDVSQIPYIGWLLAPPAAAAAFAAVEAYGSVASFDVGSNYIPQTGLAMVHQGEQIIPANAQGPAYNGGGAGGGDTYNITVQAIDTQTGAQFLKSNARTIAQVISQQVRNQNSNLPGWKAA